MLEGVSSHAAKLLTPFGDSQTPLWSRPPVSHGTRGLGSCYCRAALPVTTVTCLGKGRLGLERDGRKGECGCFSLSIKHVVLYRCHQDTQRGGYGCHRHTLRGGITRTQGILYRVAAPEESSWGCPGRYRRCVSNIAKGARSRVAEREVSCVWRAPEERDAWSADSLWLQGQPLASGRDRQGHCDQRRATQSSIQKAVVNVEGFREVKRLLPPR